MRKIIFFKSESMITPLISKAKLYFDSVKTPDSATARAALKTVSIENRALIQTHALPIGDALVTTDHKGYIHQQGNGAQTHARNLTMQSSETLPVRGHYPNGYNAPETKVAYDQRIIRLAKETAEYLLENPKAKVHFQEFMITHPTRVLFMNILKSRGITHKLYATRTFSVATLLPENSPFRLAKEIMKEINSDPELIGRFLVFQSSNAFYEINGHLPFRQTEAAFKKIYRIIFTQVAKHLDEGLETVSMTAYCDTNLSPEIQKKLHKEAYESFVAERSANQQAIKGTSILLISENCHLQNEQNGKKALVSVDSCNETIFERAAHYQYEQKTAYQAKTRLGYYASMIVGSAVVLANTIGDVAGEIAAESAFEIVAQEAGFGVTQMLKVGLFAAMNNAAKQSFSEETVLAVNENSFSRKLL